MFNFYFAVQTDHDQGSYTSLVWCTSLLGWFGVLPMCKFVIQLNRSVADKACSSLTTPRSNALLN